MNEAKPLCIIRRALKKDASPLSMAYQETLCSWPPRVCIIPEEIVQVKIQIASDRSGFFTTNPGLIFGAAGSTTQTGEF
jgi:hypothetical protein